MPKKYNSSHISQYLYYTARRRGTGTGTYCTIPSILVLYQAECKLWMQQKREGGGGNLLSDFFCSHNFTKNLILFCIFFDGLEYVR
jgi:hypothetical protein